MTENKFDLTIYGEPATEQPPTAPATEQTLLPQIPPQTPPPRPRCRKTIS